MADGPPVHPPSPALDIDTTVGVATDHWRRAGMPRARRQVRAEQLADHLRAAAADGQRVWDAVGGDPEALAAEWLRVEWRRPWLVRLLDLVAGVSLALGALALFDLLLGGGGPTQLGPWSLGIIVGALAFHQVLHRRHRWSRGQIVAQVVGAAAALVVVLGLVMARATLAVTVPRPAVWLLLAAGGALGGLTHWLKLRRLL